jgi:hypothetical protein
LCVLDPLKKLREDIENAKPSAFSAYILRTSSLRKKKMVEEFGKGGKLGVLNI